MRLSLKSTRTKITGIFIFFRIHEGKKGITTKESALNFHFSSRADSDTSVGERLQIVHRFASRSKGQKSGNGTSNRYGLALNKQAHSRVDEGGGCNLNSRLSFCTFGATLGVASISKVTAVVPTCFGKISGGVIVAWPSPSIPVSKIGGSEGATATQSSFAWSGSDEPQSDVTLPRLFVRIISVLNFEPRGVFVWGLRALL